jgi:4-azaleucine resistance transporter AzlC
MRAKWRTPDADLIRDAAALSVAAGVVGMSFGAIAIAGGLPGWVPITMSLFIFAGGSQFLAIALLGLGNPLAAVAGGLLINARHLPFGLAVGSTVGDTLGRKLIGSHILIDESTAFALAQDDPRRRRDAFWLVGVFLFLTWNAGVVAGVVLGGMVGDPAIYGLDAMFPAALLALVLPSLRDPATRAAALTGAVVAVAATPVLPAGLPILISLVGLLLVPFFPVKQEVTA